MNDTLYLRCKEKNIMPLHVCEVGVYLPEASNVLGFIKDGITTTLVEADPVINEKLRTFFANDKNVTLVEYAVYNENRQLEFCRADASTFARDIPSSPALANDKFDIKKANTFTVEAKRFDEIDNGSIDLLSIDTEGCDWYVIQNMTSRPTVISIETGTKNYINPFIKEINEWMQSNGYEIWYRERSDTVYVRKGSVQFTFTEKVRTALGFK